MGLRKSLARTANIWAESANASVLVEFEEVFHFLAAHLGCFLRPRRDGPADLIAVWADGSAGARDWSEPAIDRIAAVIDWSDFVTDRNAGLFIDCDEKQWR